MSKKQKDNLTNIKWKSTGIQCNILHDISIKKSLLGVIIGTTVLFHDTSSMTNIYRNLTRPRSLCQFDVIALTINVVLHILSMLNITILE